MKIELRERRDIPVWLASPMPSGQTYYRAELPARMTGGIVRSFFKASVDGRMMRGDLSEEFLRQVRGCSTLVLYGLGRPTIIPLGHLADLRNDPFIDALQSVAGVLFDVDDPPWRGGEDKQYAEDITRRVVLALVTHQRCEGYEWITRNFEGTFVTGANGLPTPMQLMRLQDTVLWYVTGMLACEPVRPPADWSIRLVRELIAATVPLSDAAREAAPHLNIKVAQNAVDPVDFQGSTKPAGGAVRIGYGSCCSHMADAALIMPALRKCAQIPNVEVWFFGWHPAWARDLVIGRPKVLDFDGLVFHHAGMIMDTRAYFRACGILDIALAPLQDSPRSKCRGSSKWFESSMHRTPMVLSDMPPYAPAEHGITCLKARTAEEFTEYAVQLCKDAELRKRIGGAAYDAVMANHTITACAGQWRAAVGIG